MASKTVIRPILVNSLVSDHPWGTTKGSLTGGEPNAGLITTIYDPLTPLSQMFLSVLESEVCCSEKCNGQLNLELQEGGHIETPS